MNSGYGNRLLLKYSMFIVTMKSLMLNFVEDCKKKLQTQSFSGVGASLLHGQFKPSCTWSGHLWFMFLCTGANVVLIIWRDYTVKYAFWFHKCIPNVLSCLTSMESLTKTKANHFDLVSSHDWGYPFYILDPKLQGEHNS